jgi:hypothetical protein
MKKIPRYRNHFSGGRSIALPRSDYLVWKTRPGDPLQRLTKPTIDVSVTAYLRTLAGTNQDAELGLGDRAVSPY